MSPQNKLREQQFDERNGSLGSIIPVPTLSTHLAISAILPLLERGGYLTAGYGSVEYLKTTRREREGKGKGLSRRAPAWWRKCDEKGKMNGPPDAGEQEQRDREKSGRRGLQDEDKVRAW